MVLRRRQLRREEETVASEGVSSPHETRRYRMAQRLVSIGDDFFIQNDHGEPQFKVDGQALRVRETLMFRNMEGEELCKIQQRLMRVRDTMEVEGPGGDALAQVKKAIISPLRDRYVINIAHGPDLTVHGNILDHEFQITNGRSVVAQVSKRWFRVRDSYGVEIGPGQNDILILAATVCIDQMSNPM